MSEDDLQSSAPSEIFSQETYQTIWQLTQPTLSSLDLMDPLFMDMPSCSMTPPSTVVDLDLSHGVLQLPIASNTIQHPTYYEDNLDNIPGDYGFGVSLECDDKPSKSVPWTYSKLLDKLFVSYDNSCPIKFTFEYPPIEGCTIRAMAVYKKPEYVNDIVVRCFNHKQQERSAEPGAPEHLIRCESQTAMYCNNQMTGRYSVVVPYHKPNDFPNIVSHNYKFMCFSSCNGGMNRREIFVVYSLEYNGQLIGRRLVHTRICACAGRDRSHEEKRYNKRNSTSDNESLSGFTHLIVPPEKAIRDSNKMTMDMKKLMERHHMTEPTTNRKRKGNNEEVGYIIPPVRRKEHYDILMEIKAALELKADLQDIERAGNQNKGVKGEP